MQEAHDLLGRKCDLAMSKVDELTDAKIQLEDALSDTKVCGNSNVLGPDAFS